MDEHKKNRLIRSAFYFSIIVALITLGAKLYGWFVTGSQSILASLIDSAIDISCSIINLVVLIIASRPPDNNHRFGREKFQDLAVFSQSMFFFSSGMFIMFSSAKSIFYRTNPMTHGVGLNFIYICIIATICLIIYQAYVIKITGSDLIKADRTHYVSDLLTDFAVVISLALSASYPIIDPIAGMIISVYILYSSYSLLKTAIDKLVDKEFPTEDKEKILFIISKYSEVKGVHELKTRLAANKPFIQFHLELEGTMSLSAVHEISDKICHDLLVEFPKGEIIIHQDPAGLETNVNYPEQLSIRDMQ
ncbi:MAG: cation transporter [Rickettsiaceae bacterium]|nr:MAG: cation transporter [Rickettsiaceae bacterium]